MSRRDSTPSSRGRLVDRDPTGVSRRRELSLPPTLTPQNTSRRNNGGRSLPRRRANLDITPLFQKDLTKRAAHTMSPEDMQAQEQVNETDTFAHRRVLTTPPGPSSPKGYDMLDGTRPKDSPIGRRRDRPIDIDYDEGEYVSEEES